MANFSQLEKEIFHHIRAGDWNTAIEKAKAIPPHWDIWQQLPSAAPMPNEAVHKVLDHLSNPQDRDNGNLNYFIFDMSHHLHDKTSPDVLNRLASLSPDDRYIQKNILSHPNWKPDENTQSLNRAANFWFGYEQKPGPHHFATVKSMFTGKPEELIDHRGQKGASHDTSHLIPDIKNHAKSVQSAIMEDPNIPKRLIRGEPHIQLWRGVNGHYGKLIRDKANYDPSDNLIDKTTFHIPTAHLTSWTTRPKMAEKFAWDRGRMEGQPSDQGIVMNQWIPVKDVLHSGQHKSVIGQSFAQPDEREIVVGHPEGKIRISTENMKMQAPPKHTISSDYADNMGEMKTPQIYKSENDNDIIDLTEEVLVANVDLEGVSLRKDMKHKLIPAITALSILGADPSGYADASMHQNAPKIQQVKPAHSIKKENTPFHPGLNPIQMIESSSGKDTSHKPIDYGVNAGTRAYGKFGLMPLTIVETVKRSPALSRKYAPLSQMHHQKDHDKIHEYMSSHPNAENDIANAHWKRLSNTFHNDTDKMAYAWNNGITGTKKASDEKIKSNDYVQKYNKFKKMNDLEHPNVKKSEGPEKESLNDVREFIPFTDVQQNSKEIAGINSAIKSGNLHDLSNVGHFTHDSFLAGFDRDNSWLIKVEPFGTRPSIQSARSGLQTVKEATFYYVANMIFGAGDFTPKAILGEIVRGEHRIPAVAIKMYPKIFKSAKEMKKTKPGSMQGILEKYRKSGELHKLALMLFILGEADAHGGNLLTDGEKIKLIDHGTSFADANFDPSKDDSIFIPFMLRAWGYKDSMSTEEKMKSLPKIDDDKIKLDVVHWLNALDHHKLAEVLNKFSIDPAPSLFRLRALQQMSKKFPIDDLINTVWVKGLEAANEAH